MRAMGVALLYLLAANAVFCALAAWGGADGPTLAGWAVALLVALAAGERLGEPLSLIEDKRRDKMAVFLGTIQLSVLVLALMLAAGKPSAGLLRFVANVLAGFQLLVLALARLAPQPRGVVGHSLALAALAGFHGGALGAWSIASTLALVGLCVGVDHHSRLLLAHRVEEEPHAAGALGRSAALVLPVALAVGLGVFAAQPQPRRLADAAGPEQEEYRPLDEQPQRELDRRALRAVVLTGLAGAVAVYALGRFLVRSRRRSSGPIETPEPLRGALERIQPERRRSRRAPSYTGRRGRIVRAYLDLLRGAEGAGFARRPDETAAEFAEALGEPRQPLQDATDAFTRARYAPGEPSDADVARAERSSAAVVAHVGRQPPRKKRPTTARER